MRRWHLHLASISTAIAAVFIAGCSPEIGDKCNNSTDCSLRGDRLCDTTQPSGYCTVFNCEPGSCPEEAQCVAFADSLDPVCTDPQLTPRFQRTFCMKRCEDEGDCRSGYQCADMSVQPNQWGGSVVDFDPEGRKVCIAKAPAPSEVSGQSDFCRPYDGGYPDVSYFEPDSPPEIDSGDDVMDAGVDAPEAGVDASDASADAADASTDGSDAADASDTSQDVTDAEDASDSADAVDDVADAPQEAD